MRELDKVMSMVYGIPMVPKSASVVFFVFCFFLGINSPCAAEKIFCNDGTLIEGDIIRFERGVVWMDREAGSTGIGIKRIEKILNDDGSLSPYDYKNVLARITDYIGERKYTEAKSLCGSLLGYFDGNARALYLHAVLNQKTGDVEGAIKDYLVLMERGLADPGAYNNLGSIYADRKDFPKAIDLYKKALDKDPASAQVHNNLADVYMLTEDYTRAFEEYSNVAAREPANARVLYNLGVLYLQKNDFARARESWEKVLALSPDDSEAKKALQELKNMNTL